MIWRFLAVVVGGTAIASFTDWLFMGVLFHERYLRFPEVWRGEPGTPNTRRIVLSQVISLITCAAFTLLLMYTGMLRLHDALLVSVLVWAAGPLVVQAHNALWLKFDGLVAASHAAGWLVRLAITAALAAWLLPSASKLAAVALGAPAS